MKTQHLGPTLQNHYPASRVLDCPECGGEMVLRKSHKYPQPFYGCTQFPYCKATHGAHPDGAPLGIPGNKETKEWRIKAHAALDPKWGRNDSVFDKPTQKYRRKVAYNWLAGRLGIKEVRRDCHIAMFDIEKCQKVIAFCEETTWEEMEAWYQRKKAENPYPHKKKGKRRPPRYAHY